MQVGSPCRKSGVFIQRGAEAENPIYLHGTACDEPAIKALQALPRGSCSQKPSLAILRDNEILAVGQRPFLGSHAVRSLDISFPKNKL